MNLMNLDKLFNLSESQFIQMHNGTNTILLIDLL